MSDPTLGSNFKFWTLKIETFEPESFHKILAKVEDGCFGRLRSLTDFRFQGGREAKLNPRMKPSKIKRVLLKSYFCVTALKGQKGPFFTKRSLFHFYKLK